MPNQLASEDLTPNQNRTLGFSHRYIVEVLFGWWPGSMEQLMTCPPYRCNSSIRVVALHDGHYRLEQLPAGTVFYPNDLHPDQNDMIDGTCHGDEVMMSSRDLANRCDPIDVEKAL